MPSFFTFCTRCNQELFYETLDEDELVGGVATKGYWTTKPLSGDLMGLLCGDSGIHERQMMLKSSMYSHLEMIIEDLDAA